MATQETRTLVCDPCGSESRVETRTLTIGRRQPHHVEVCDSCWAPVARVYEAGRVDKEPPVLVAG